MGILSERLDAMAVQVAAPNADVVAELRNRTQVSVRFAPGAYRRHDERALEATLAGLARLLWAARMREYYAALSAAFGERITREPAPQTEADRAFLADRARLVAEGSSADGRVRLAVRGMQNWTVRITRGSLRVLSEGEFSARVGEAAGHLIDNQLAEIWRLKQKHYEGR